jgi:hypothetical protein
VADEALLAAGVQAAPFQYTIPGAQEIIIKAITASFDGTGASGSWIPTLQVIAPNGAVLASCPGSVLAAGALADVSWFPGVSENLVAQPGSPGAQLDYVQSTTDLTVTASTAATSQVFIQGNPIAFDGATRIRIEYFVAAAYLDPGGDQPYSLVGELFDGLTDIGTITQNNNHSDLPTVNPQYGTYVTTPSAGTHTYAITYWLSPSATILAQLLCHGGAGAYLPAYYRITANPLV